MTAPPDFNGFPTTTFKFLKTLKKNNNRDWFKKNKQRYEDEVLQPSLDFVEAMQKPLKKISPYFLAVPKRVGGSLMRVYRDTRFSKDKTPYKANVGIHFRHEFGKDVHAPGFYVHLEPGECFFGAGIWRPDSAALKKIRDQIVEEPGRYSRICRSKNVQAAFKFAGESLKRPPRGFDVANPLINELKRKDFILLGNFEESLASQQDFASTIGSLMRQAMPLVRFLCDAMRVPS